MVCYRYQRDAEAYVGAMRDADLIELYRLDKEGIHHFLHRIEEKLQPKTKAGLSPLLQLLVALRYYATGNSLHSLKNTGSFQLSHGSVYNSIKNTSKALAELLPEDVSYPLNAEKITAIKQGFFTYGGFPGIIGAIDGTMIKIKAPPIDEHIYVGRKTDGHYLNVQYVCDHNQRFLDAVIRWPGSVPDCTIWEMSNLKPLLEEYIQKQGSGYNGWLIGDSGYSQRTGMMIPLADPTTRSEQAYNAAHKKCRCTIERAIGTLKSRFRCLCKQTGGCLQFDLDVNCNIIASCTVLHNYCRSRNMSHQPALEIDTSEDSTYSRTSSSSEDTDELIRGYTARNTLIRDYF